MVFYRKYRPQTLEQLIGQAQVKLALSSAFENNKLSHAYLFVGPRGTGKTSTARILAKMVNCQGEKPPCNKCAACLSITDGSNLDLIEIDAASNRGIDDIRALRETIKLAPSAAKKKIYIIDEVHMLTPDAFNALLKTLEEPPEHVLFILATTERAKIPQTILSRVQRLDFKLAKVSDLVQALKVVADGEKIKVDEEALKLLAKAADGSFRDGVKLLDQLSSANKEISAKEVIEGLKTSDFNSMVNLLETLAKKDTTQALMLVTKILAGGVHVKEFILDLMDLMRNILFIKNGLGESLVKEDVGSDKYEILTGIDFSAADLIFNLDKLQEALEKLRVVSIPSLPLEIAVVEMTQSVILSEVSPKADESKDLKINPEIATLPVVARNDDYDKTDSSDIIKIKEKWTFVLETIRPYNFSLEALLRSVKIADCSSGVVLLEVPYSFHQRILEAPKSRDLLESVLSDVLQQTIKVSTVLSERPRRIEDVANIEVAADDEVIRMASEIFNGKLVD